VNPNADADRLDVNVDYSNLGGYFVRVDIELPNDARYPAAEGAPATGWLGLTPDEADAFAARLGDMAHRARQAANARPYSSPYSNGGGRTGLSTPEPDESQAWMDRPDPPAVNP
jgi:hypothetical protein